MRINSYIIVILVLAQLSATAQFRYEEDRMHVNFSIGYQAMLDLPSDHQKFRSGVHFSVAPSLVNKFKEKQQKKTGYNRIIDRDIYIKLNISTYKRKDLHHALLIDAGPSFRITLPEGLAFEFGGSIGYMRTFLSGDHFIFEGNDLSTTRALGSNLITISSLGTFGWNFYKSHQYPVYLYSSAGLMTYFPTNGSWTLQPVFQAGIGFALVRIKESYQ